VSALAAAVAAAVPGARSSAGFGPVTVDVTRERWVEALGAAHAAGATFFDLLTAYDDGPTGVAVVAHLATPDLRDHLLLRTPVPAGDPALPTATGVYRGAAWHERETHEMFGIGFDGHPRLAPLLLPDGFEGHPLRKDFVLAARAAKEWPGVKEPGERPGPGAERPVPRARRRGPPHVPDGWGPA